MDRHRLYFGVDVRFVALDLARKELEPKSKSIG
jgi:hypothetical protein